VSRPGTHTPGSFGQHAHREQLRRLHRDRGRRPGDVVEAEIEKLGILRNPVISWRDAYGSDAPAADSWI
jgi:2-keto-4-pentenoate hydratase/2-oxohepta-3-ene-1,7-dioic acid hydratase in catechol pathway